MKLEHAAEIINDSWIIGMLVQAFVEMVDEQPSNVRMYDYALMFKDYNGRQQKTLLPAPALPRDKEQAENVIRRVVQDSVSGFADFLLQRNIILGEPDTIEVTYGIPEPGIDDILGCGVDDIPGSDYDTRATLHVTWKSEKKGESMKEEK